MTPPPSFRLPPNPRILVRGVNWLGDAVMTTPALIRLREHLPSARITMFCPEKLGQLWPRHPAIDETLSFHPGEGLFAIGRKLQAHCFDLALVFPNSPRSALEMYLGKIPIRIGHARPWRNLLLSHVIPARTGTVKMRKRTPAEIQQLIASAPTASPGLVIPTAAHQIHEYLHLTAALGASAEPLAPRLSVGQEEIDRALDKFRLPSSPSIPLLALNPGAEYGPAKRWPVEKFIAAAKMIHKRNGCHWLILGGKNDQPLADRISQGIESPVWNLAGQTTLRELMAVLKWCRALLTNDTGPMHVGAALDVPVVVPFGSTSPELTGPGLPADSRHHLLKSNVPCAPCFLRECPIDFRCMDGISIEQVVDAVLMASR